MEFNQNYGYKKTQKHLKIRKIGLQTNLELDTFRRLWRRLPHPRDCFHGELIELDSVNRIFAFLFSNKNEEKGLWSSDNTPAIINTSQP